MKEFVIYWKTGHADTVTGVSARDAFQRAGYHFAALGGVYAIEPSKDASYTWHKDTETWIKNEPAVG